jgi:hypothetical protein
MVAYVIWPCGSHGLREIGIPSMGANRNQATFTAPSFIYTQAVLIES